MLGEMTAGIVDIGVIPLIFRRERIEVAEFIVQTYVARATFIFRPSYHLGTVTSKHSPFKKIITHGMRQIIEHGMAERQKHVWQYKRPQCPASHSLNPVSVPIEEFSPALFLLLIGSIGAAAVLLGECYVKWHTVRFCIIEKYRTDPDMERPQSSIKLE